MELLNVIRRMALLLKLPIGESVRRTGVARKMVKNHQRAGTVEPKFAIGERPNKLPSFAETLAD